MLFPFRYNGSFPWCRHAEKVVLFASANHGSNSSHFLGDNQEEGQCKSKVGSEEIFHPSEKLGSLEKMCCQKVFANFAVPLFIFSALDLLGACTRIYVMLIH